MRRHYSQYGFTLIEMAVVLIIIGFVIGGVLVGQNLITSAALSAQIAQIEKYDAAVHAFQTKYLGLPGDLKLTYATNFGLVTTGCNGAAGERDGNGIIEGASGGYTDNEDEFLGETGVFWEDLSQAGFVDGTFPNSGAAARNCNTDSTLITLTPGTYYVGDFIPPAKIGNGNFVYVYTGNGVPAGSNPTYPVNSDNWFGVSAVTGTGSNGWSILSGTNISVISAYQIDAKIDDGIPVTGNVIAFYLNNNSLVSAYVPWTPSPTSCYDYTSNHYSTGQNGGNGLNCALSFRFH